jgi:hypothetical protein
MRIKAIYKKNLKMPEGKVAAQIAHAVKNLGITPLDSDIIVLKVSDKKFDELVKEHSDCYVQIDKGLTIVEEGTVTAAAWIDKTQIKRLSFDKVKELVGCNSLWEDVIFEYEGNECLFSFMAYQYCVEEYGIEDILSISGDFILMINIGIYKQLK